MAKRFIIGIDEVGRGPLAGPVAVGAVAASPRMLREFRAIKESKQLSPAQREIWNKKMRAALCEELRITVSFVGVETIDRIGIVPAIRRALRQSLGKLGVDPDECTVLLDGGLKAPPAYHDQRTIIHGDASETVIAMASVAAKVVRDRLMVRLDAIHPEYGFALHKGYGTALHMRALEKHGLSPLHRRSFCKAFL